MADSTWPRRLDPEDHAPMNTEWRTKNGWAVDLAEERDRRIVSGPPAEPITMTSLLVWTKNKLRDVAAPGVDADKLVQMTGGPQEERALVCGDRTGAAFVRRDGVACNFKIVVRALEKKLELLSYVLHLNSPPGHAVGPRFLRWEYSSARKTNVDALKEPLAHLHPGHDCVRLPSAVLSPRELITVFLAIEIWE